MWRLPVAKITLSLLVGYDISQLRLSGKFSHKPSDQRVLQFSTEFRDLEPGNRIYIGASSMENLYRVS